MNKRIQAILYIVKKDDPITTNIKVIIDHITMPPLYIVLKKCFVGTTRILMSTF